MDEQRIHKSIWLGIALCFILGLYIADSANRENMGLPSAQKNLLSGQGVTVVTKEIKRWVAEGSQLIKRYTQE